MRRAKNIFKRKDGRWEGRYADGIKENGRKKYASVYAKSYSECLEKLDNARNNENISSKPITVSRLYNEWLESRRKKIKQSTFVNYQVLYQNHISSFFGSMRAEEVSVFEVNRWINSLLENGNKKSGEGLSSKSVQAILIIFKSIYDYGEKVYSIKNPTKNVALPKLNQTEITVFSTEEISMIKDKLFCDEPKRLGIVLCLFTGMRIGEICALKWEDIDFETLSVHVSKTLQRIKNTDADFPKTVLIIDAPKSEKSNREMPIPTFMISKLNELKEYADKDNFFLTNSTVPLEPRSYSILYSSYLKELNIEYKSFHVLRHTFATECIRYGVDVKSVSELLGHSSVKITLERYVHSDIETKRRQLEKLYENL